MAFLLRKAFCSWLYPIGTLSEMLARVWMEDLPAQFCDQRNELTSLSAVIGILVFGSVLVKD